jgi:hypothetical protein
VSLKRMLLSCLLVVFGLAGFAALLFGIWYTHRPLPDAIQNEVLFPGITYTREIVRDPYPQIRHIVKIDLTTPGLSFFVTPQDNTQGFPYRARTTSEFLAEHHLQLAINGDYFRPFADNIIQYYPHEGDQGEVSGYTIAQGVVVTAGYSPAKVQRTMFITADNRVTFVEPPAEPVYTAISGKPMALIEGEIPAITTKWHPEYLTDRNPRTAIALDQAGTTLMLFLIDGRQPNYSEGATVPELGEIIRAHGGWNALNLDGGGSTTLVIEGADGTPVILNSPIHNRIPGRERPVANHFGLTIR